MKNVILFAWLSVIGCTQASARDFIHPSSILSMRYMERMREHIDAQEQPFVSEWEALKADGRSSSSYNSRGAEALNVPEGTRQRIGDDATAAIYNALQWHMYGDELHAQCAARILSTFANTLTSADGQLFQYPARDLCYAAEMLRNADGSFYSGWEASIRDKFLDMVRNMFVPALRAERFNGTPSWSAGAIDGLLIAGVLLDDEEIYNEAIGYFKDPDIPGSVMSAILDSGQLREMGRDMVHANLALGDLGQMAQVAYTQGDDLFAHDNNRLLRGFNYWCHANLDYMDEMESVPVGHWYYLSTHNNGCSLRPDGAYFEQVIHHYKEEVRDVDPSEYYYLDRYARVARPAAGFNSLFFIDDIETLPLFTTVPDAPTDVKATPGMGYVEVTWGHSANDDQRGFKVLRSSNGKNFYTIKTWDYYTKRSYIDKTATPGVEYYYKVRVNNVAGLSQPSASTEGVQAAAEGDLPQSWSYTDHSHSGLDGLGATYAPVQGGTFAVTGTGYDIGGKSDDVGMAYAQVTGNVTFTARLTSTAEEFYKVGLMMRKDTTAYSQRIAITLGETGWRKCRMAVRSSSNANTTWIEGNDFTYAPCWLRIKRTGNTFTTYQSRDGKTWFEIGSKSISMPNTFYVALAACTGNVTNSYRAVFDHVTIEGNTSSHIEANPTVQTVQCQYYNMEGLPIDTPNGKGLYLVRETLDNGLTRTHKVFLP